VRQPLERLSENHAVVFVFGDLTQSLRLTAVFMVGVCVYAYRDTVMPALTGWVAALAGLAAIVLMYRDPHLAEAAVSTLGAAALFWLAFKADLGPLQRINDRWDISYGVYLYGWPISTAILWFDRSTSPWSLAVTSLLLAGCFGAASWWGVENWTKSLGQKRTARRLPQPSPAAEAS
jgi:peptidoglycan/LPS O-acetylase OafA/YrhL